MNFGLIVRNGLNKCDLPDDAAHLELAKTECNFIIEDYWYLTLGKYRQSRGRITTVSGADEYILNKHFDRFVKNTIQGPSTNPRYLQYLETEEYFRRVQIGSTPSGNPDICTFGEVVGYDAQISTASTVRAFSSLASKTIGSINVSAGSDIVRSDADLFTLNDVGLRLKKDGDSKSYKIGKYIGPREIQLLEKYRGITASAAAYKIGDVGIYVNIQGFVSGQITSEEVELDGINVVTSTKTFNTLVSISKSDKTGGNVTVQDSAGTETLGVMAPGETEIERQTLILWGSPNSSEVITYRFYLKHPLLWLDTDRLLIPTKWHRLVSYKLEKRLIEWAGKEVPQGLADDVARYEQEFTNEAEDQGLSDSVPDSDDYRGRGGAFYYDHLWP